MYGALLGAGMTLAGTGYNMRADRQGAQARNDALGQLDTAIAHQGGLEAAAAQRNQAAKMELARRRYGSLNDMFTQYSAPTTVDPRMMARLQDVPAQNAAVPQYANAPQAQWGQRAAVPYDTRVANLTTLAGNAAQQDAVAQQRGEALSGFSRADERFGVEGRDFDAMASLEAAIRQRAWQHRQMQLQRMFADAQNAGDSSRRTGGILMAGGQLVGGIGGGGAAAPAAPAAPAARKNWSPTGQQVGGGYYGALYGQ